MESFRKKLEEIINQGRRKNDLNTPDFILAEYLENCLKAFDLVNRREEWYRKLKEPNIIEGQTRRLLTKDDAFLVQPKI